MKVFNYMSKNCISLTLKINFCADKNRTFFRLPSGPVSFFGSSFSLILGGLRNWPPSHHLPVFELAHSLDPGQTETQVIAS